jgi:hypothetical protein
MTTEASAVYKIWKNAFDICKMSNIIELEGQLKWLQIVLVTVVKPKISFIFIPLLWMQISYAPALVELMHVYVMGP